MSEKGLILPDAPVRSVPVLREQLERLAVRANVLAPLAIDSVAPGHAVSLRAVKIDPSVDKDGFGTDTYRDGKFCKPDERALTRTGLLRIWQAANGNVLESRPLSIDGYCVDWQVKVALPAIDGRMLTVIATKRVDLNDDSPEVVGWSDKRLIRARANLLPLAESKALNRAIRSALALRQKYKVSELERPFVIPAIVPDLDADENLKAALLQHVMGSLYGVQAAAGAAQIEAPRVAAADQEVIDVRDEPDEDESPDAGVDEPAEAVTRDGEPWPEITPEILRAAEDADESIEIRGRRLTRRDVLEGLQAVINALRGTGDTATVQELLDELYGCDPLLEPLERLVVLGQKAKQRLLA